jgi:hypothetical protein
MRGGVSRADACIELCTGSDKDLIGGHGSGKMMVVRRTSTYLMMMIVHVTCACHADGARVIACFSNRQHESRDNAARA